MKLLIYEWKAYLEEDVLAICREKKISYDTFSWFFKDKNRDEEFVRELCGQYGIPLEVFRVDLESISKKKETIS